MVDGWCCRRAWGAGWVSGLPSSCLWLLVALSFCPVQLSFFFFFLPVRPHDVTTAAPWLATDIDGSAWAVHGCEANYEAQADRPLTSFFPFSLPLCSPSPSPSPSILLFSRPLLRDLSLCSSPSSTYPPATLPVPYTGPRSLPGLDHNHGPCAIHVHVPLVSLVLLFSRTIPLELPLLPYLLATLLDLAAPHILFRPYFLWRSFMDHSLSSLQYQEPAFLQPAQQYRDYPQPQRGYIHLPNPSTSSFEILSISNPLSTVLQTQGQHFHPRLGPVAAELRLLPHQPSQHLAPQQHLSQEHSTDDRVLWQTQASSHQPLSFDSYSIMDGTSWTGSNTSAHQTVGPIPMGLEWARDQGLTSSDSSARSISLQGAFHTSSNNQNGNGSGNGTIHSQASSLTGGPGHLGVEAGLSSGSVHGGVGGVTHHNGDPLASSLAASTLQGDLVRTTPPTPSREDFQHHSHTHHQQQQQQSQQPLHVHHTHSPYHHGQLSGHELSPHEQQQQQQQLQQQQQFQPQHSAYASGHYYPEQDQHESYEHDRMHSGGLVGHPYGHSHDNIAALTPPPSAPVPQHDLPPLRTRLTNTIWEDEHTFCFQVDVKGVCVARRADNNMVNGTKLLNVVGMSRGKRDGILKNEKGRVVVKVGAMHLKGVWIPLDRAAHHAKAHNIEESLYPLLVDDPATFLYQHPHSTSVPDVRWNSQQQQHGYHESDNSPKARHSDMHSNHHFNQGVHGDYYSHQQHAIFRGHGVNSPHGSPHGSNGSISGDDDPNLVSPFEYRVPSSIVAGGLVGIPSGGPSSVSDLRQGNHHATYYGHQASPNQYYGAHVQKYPDPILHPGQHQLQLGGPLANDSPPPLSNTSGHDGPQNRLQANLLTGQKRGYGANVPEATHSYYGYQTHPQKSHSLPDAYPTDPNPFGLASGMNTGNFSPPVSMPSSEPHSPMSQQHQSHHSQDQHGDLQIQNTARHSHGPIVQPLNPPSKRPRQVSRGMSLTADSPASSSGQWYGRDDSFDRASGQSIATSHHSMSSNETLGSGPINYALTGDGSGGMYYEALAQQPKSFNATREGDAGLAGRPRFMPGTAQAPMQYGATGASSPQRSRSRLSSFQDPTSAGMAQQGTISSFGRVQNSMSPDDTKQAGYVRAQSGPEGESNVQLIKVEGVSGGFGHDATSWT